MFRKALVAIDLDSTVLLDCAGDLKSWGVQDLELFYGVKVGYAQGPFHDQLTRSKQRIEELAGQLKSEGFTVEVKVQTAGDIAASIVEAAVETKADLVVIGNRAQNILERVFLGSVARSVLRKAKLPVLLQWVGLDETSEPLHCDLICTDTLKHVLFATDLEKGSRAAKSVLLGLAKLGAQIDCVHVTEASERERYPEWDAMVAGALGDMCKDIRALDSECESFVLTGEPHEALLTHAEKRSSTLIVIGKNAGDDFKLGTTAQRLSKAAMRPVLMVPTV